MEESIHACNPPVCLVKIASQQGHNILNSKGNHCKMKTASTGMVPRPFKPFDRITRRDYSHLKHIEAMSYTKVSPKCLDAEPSCMVIPCLLRKAVDAMSQSVCLFSAKEVVAPSSIQVLIRSSHHNFFFFFFLIHYWVFKAPLNSYQLHFL